MTFDWQGVFDVRKYTPTATPLVRSHKYNFPAGYTHSTYILAGSYQLAQLALDLYEAITNR